MWAIERSIRVNKEAAKNGVIDVEDQNEIKN
jgi:hypothetical protein